MGGGRQVSMCEIPSAKVIFWVAHPFEVTEASPIRTILQWLDAELPPLLYRFCELAPTHIVSFDPSNRIERQFQEAHVPLKVVPTRRQVPVRRGCHNLFKIGGDLQERIGLYTTKRYRNDIVNDKDKRHIVREVRRILTKGDVVYALKESHPSERQESRSFPLPPPYETLFRQMTHNCAVIWR